MQSEPLVTVYIATRNRELLVLRAIESVLAQTYRNLELIVVDDGSTDSTAVRIRNRMAQHTSATKWHLVQLDAQAGACAARNRAIDLATGELITGLDDDDYFAADRVASLVRAFEPQVDAFVFDGYVRESRDERGRLHHRRVRLPAEVNLPALLARNVVGNQVLTLTERLRGVGGFDERLPAWQDYDLWIRLVRRYGPGRSAGGNTYYLRENHGAPRISDDAGRIRTAMAMFLSKHLEYEDPRLRACLGLSKACYGADYLSASDVLRIAATGNARLMAAAAYFFLRNRISSR